MNIKAILEAILFIHTEGITLNEILNNLKNSTSEKIDKQNIRILLDSLVDDYLERSGGVYIQEKNQRYQFTTTKESYPYIQSFIISKNEKKLSNALLETLAIIAYKQPITLAEIDSLRGISSRSLVLSLLEKKLIQRGKQREIPGKPIEYTTTKYFLKYLSLSSLKELPSLQEIKELNINSL